MVEPTDVTTYEFLSKDGNLSDEFVPGTTAFRVRECGTRRTAEFLRLVPPSVQIAEERADTRRVLYPHELSDEIKAEFHKGYQGEPTPELDPLME